MKKFIKALALFSIPAALYIIFSIVALPHLLSLVAGPTTKDQIDRSFTHAVERDYSLLILGNSRCYRGINPDMLSLSAYNFSHDNDSYNQLYFKLRYLLEKQKKIRYLILGVDYFEFGLFFNTRNYVYADYFVDEYEKDYDDSILKLKLDYYIENANPKKLKILTTRSKPPFLKDNGQYIKFGKAKESDNIRREISRLKIQESYFHKILALCKQENIKAFLVMPPVRKNELNSYTAAQMQEFDTFIRHTIDSNAVYLNYSLDSTFTIKDYTDITHLNEAAADRFTKIVDDSLKRHITNLAR